MVVPLPKDRLKQVYNNVAARYDWQHGLLTLWSDQRGRRLLVSKTVQNGDQVLDAGGGTGSTAIMAAEAVGPSGDVVVHDFSAGMLDEARTKANRSGLRDKHSFCIGDMTRLPFPENRFHVALSTYSTCPLHDPATAARELYRVVKPGGKIGVAHSTLPSSSIMRGLAAVVEEMYWRIPQLSLGCRAVDLLPTFQGLGGRVTSKWRIGVPLWPFLVFIVKKPID